MSYLFITAGTKGGIGKTLIATLLADSARMKGFPVTLYDCDNENKSLTNAYPNAPEDCRIITVNLNKDETDMDYPMDFIVNDMAEQEKTKPDGNSIYIVDTKAGTTHSTLDWLEFFPFDEISGMGIKIYITGCVTSDVDSVQTLSKWIYKYYEASSAGIINFLIIKNYFHGNDFEIFEDIMNEYLEDAKNFATIVDLPDLSIRNLKIIKGLQTSYGQVASGETPIDKFSLMETGRIKRRFKGVMERFDVLWENKQENPGAGG